MMVNITLLLSGLTMVSTTFSHIMMVNITLLLSGLNMVLNHLQSYHDGQYYFATIGAKHGFQQPSVIS